MKVLVVAALALAIAGCRRDDSAASSPPATNTATGAKTAEARTPDGVPVDIPTTRSGAPSVPEWDAAPNVQVASTSGTGCSVKMVREWVRVDCGKRANGAMPNGVDVKSGCTKDTYTSMKTHANAVSALSRGHRCELQITWADVAENFVADWPSGAARPGFAFFHDAMPRPQPARH